jgi:hypothetical protein
VKKLMLAMLFLAACGPAPEPVDPVYAQNCYDAGSTLDSNNVCVWPLFGTIPTSVNPTPGPCSGIRRGFSVCADCHTMGATGGWHEWSPAMQPRPMALVTSGGCVLCHKAAP